MSGKLNLMSGVGPRADISASAHRAYRASRPERFVQPRFIIGEGCGLSQFGRVETDETMHAVAADFVAFHRPRLSEKSPRELCADRRCDGPKKFLIS